ncbi:MAG: hypothetical protein K0S24_3997 [Sphingobacterium sp.]|jgi:hypothetical protein|nr:hypothetical protein [Sphingobacterium sp.]
MPDGVGLSIGVNAYGFSGSLNIAVDEMNNFGFYGSVTSSIGYPSVSPSIGAGVGLDFYENTLPNAGLLGEIAGTTVDTGVGVGNWGLTYSSPVEVKNGLIRKIRGAHKLSVGYSGSYSPYSSGNFSFSYGIGRTRRF